MENENQKAENEVPDTSQSLVLTEKTIRALRRNLTRNKGGGFETCDDHERRMRASTFSLAIYADPSQHSVIVKATAKVTCGHSKHPCTDTRTMTLADDTGISPRALRVLKAIREEGPEIGEEEEEAD